MTVQALAAELVVLLDEEGNAIGTADKRAVHHHDTPLHLAFSCYLFDASGRVLLTRRALDKTTWPGVWTNSCCGHPAPSETLDEAVLRRVRQELGIEAQDLRLLLPTFRYRAAMPEGIVENEMCPVLVATTSETPRPDPAEVVAFEWTDWDEFRAAVLDGTRDVSPWCAQQVAELPPRPWLAPAQPASSLPVAIRPGSDP